MTAPLVSFHPGATVHFTDATDQRRPVTVTGRVTGSDRRGLLVTARDGRRWHVPAACLHHGPPLEVVR